MKKFWGLMLVAGLLWGCIGILFSSSFHPTPYLLVDPMVAFFPFNLALLPWVLASISSKLLPFDGFLVDGLSLFYGVALTVFSGHLYVKLKRWKRHEC